MQMRILYLTDPIFINQNNVCISRKSRFFTEKKIGRNFRDFSGFQVFMNFSQEANHSKECFSRKMQKRSLYLHELIFESTKIQIWRKSKLFTIFGVSRFFRISVFHEFYIETADQSENQSSQKMRKIILNLPKFLFE